MISSESRMDFDGGVDVFDVKTGVGGIVFIGFAVSATSTLATPDEDDGVASREAGGEFVEPDCGAGVRFGASAESDGTD